MCSFACADAVCMVLENTNLYNVQTIGPDSWPKKALTAKNLREADCIVFPGGDGDLDQYDKNIFRHKSLIKKFIANGGKYLGICMGGYFAGEYCFDVLQDFSTKQFIKRKNSCTKNQGPCNLSIKWMDNKTYPVYFHDGAAFVPKTNFLPKQAQVFGQYKNKDIAVLTCPYGKGKVGVMGPHLEAQKWWFYSQSKIKNGWKTSIQHKLFEQLFKSLIHD